MRAWANRDIVALHKKAEACSERIDEVLYGMPVEILEEMDGWCRIKTEYWYEGYCRRKELLTGADFFAEGETAVVMQCYADVLSEPRVQGICLQSIPLGGRVRRIAAVQEHEGWIEVQLVDQRIGYMKEKFLGPYYPEMFTQREAVFRRRVVEMAKWYLGVQYRWGGKSSLGIDCSGLTSMAYLLCGVRIFRDSEIREGFPVHEIAFSDKRPGDLLYFPGHIAMYIGEGCYIHATGKNGSDGVVINSLEPGHPLYREDLPGKLKYVGSIF